MFNRIMYFSIHNKLIIGIFVSIIIGAGIYSLAHLPLDAVPDITDNQVQIITSSPDQSEDYQSKGIHSARTGPTGNGAYLYRFG